MTDLGEILNNSTLLLELLTTNELGETVWADSSPVAVVTVADQLGVIEVASVTLNEKGNMGEYAYDLEIPLDWAEGNYLITYSVTINGSELTLQETFTLKHVEAIEETENEDIEEVENEEITEEIIEDSTEQVEEVVRTYGDLVFGDKNTYVLPSDFQIECEMVITETGVTLIPKENLKYNHTYMLVIGKGIQSLSQESAIESTEHISFTSEYSPLYATPLEVRAIIRNFFPYFKIDEIYAALRDAGEKAHVYKDLVPDANNSRFKKAQERDTYYFALTKYQAYEASRVLLTKLLMFLLQGDGNPNDNTFNGGGSGNASEGGFTLGDFTASGAAGPSGGDIASIAASNKKLLEDLIREIEKDLKFWQDSMMGHHRRSYAKPTSASFRSDGGSPGSRTF